MHTSSGHSTIQFLFKFFQASSNTGGSSQLVRTGFEMLHNKVEHILTWTHVTEIIIKYCKYRVLEKATFSFIGISKVLESYLIKYMYKIYTSTTFK